MAAPLWQQSWLMPQDNALVRRMAAACEVFARTKLTHIRPSFGIDTIQQGADSVPVVEEVVDRTPFCSLVHFQKITDGKVPEQPRVLLVTPMSGHFATLLRGTVEVLLRDHDVYLTDWHNARDVPLYEGRFDLGDYTDHVIRFLDVLGPDSHVMAVCQPTVAVLAAVSLMAAEHHPAQPRTMTLMAGPLDCRVNPTEVNRLASGRPIEWFEQNMLGIVPWRYRGACRKVYPGFLQLTAFMSMNMGRHAEAFRNMYHHLAEGEAEKAKPIQDFYEEYFAMADLPAEFYLDTVSSVFQEYLLPLGKLEFRGRRVEPQAIKKTWLFTIEGERDDICSVGQTLAAQDMCSGIRPYMKQHHVQTGVGHYGVFSGRRWENEIYPRVREFIHNAASISKTVSSLGRPIIGQVA